MADTKRTTRKRRSAKAPNVGPTSDRPGDPPVALPIEGFQTDSFVASADELRSRLAEIARPLSTLTKSCDVLRNLGPLAALAQTDAAATLGEGVEQLASLVDPLKTTLDAVRARLNEWRQAERNSRRHRFEAGVSALQLTLAGSWPEPVVNGIVFIVVDEANDRASVNGRPLRSIPTAEYLLDVAQESLLELEQQRSEPQDFAATLWKAFRGCGGQPGSAGVTVFDLIGELAWQRQSKSFARDPRTDLFRGYSAAQFRADLTHYLAAGAMPVRDGKAEYRLEVIGGSFSQDGIFMYFPQTQRLGTCGRLAFKAVEEGE